MRGGLLFDIGGPLADTDRVHLQTYQSPLPAFGAPRPDHAIFVRAIMGFARSISLNLDSLDFIQVSGFSHCLDASRNPLRSKMPQRGGFSGGCGR
jgi:hypothetical protein